MRSKKALYNISTNLLLQVFILAYGFVVPKLIINNYGSEVYGLISSISQLLSYITLLESGVGSVVKASLYKPLSKFDSFEIVNILKASEKFFRCIAFIFLIYIFILSFIYPNIIDTKFDGIFTVSLIVIISISTFAEYFFGMTYKLLIQADQNTYVISIIQIFSYVLSVVAIMLMVKLQFSIHELKLYSSLIFLIRPIIQNYYVKKKYNLNLGEYDKEYKLNNKWDGLAQHIAFVIHNNVDVTILTFFSTLVNVSIYSVYSIVTRGIKSLIQSFTIGIDSSWGDMLAKQEYKLLNEKFSTYETIYFCIATIVYSCALVLIIPFVEVYTLDIVDANYIIPTFGFLIVLSEFVWAIRLPYSSITLAAGHFKETQKGAWIECGINVVISLMLVKRFGLSGIAVGTVCAMTIRTLEYVYHTNKYILKRTITENLKKIFSIVFQTIIIIVISKTIPLLSNTSYVNWFINAIIVFGIALLVAIITNLLFYKKELKSIIVILKKVFSNRKRKVG